MIPQVTNFSLDQIHALIATNAANKTEMETLVSWLNADESTIQSQWIATLLLERSKIQHLDDSRGMQSILPFQGDYPKATAVAKELVKLILTNLFKDGLRPRECLTDAEFHKRRDSDLILENYQVFNLLTPEQCKELLTDDQSLRSLLIQRTLDQHRKYHWSECLPTFVLGDGDGTLLDHLARNAPITPSDIPTGYTSKELLRCAFFRHMRIETIQHLLEYGFKDSIEDLRLDLGSLPDQINRAIALPYLALSQRHTTAYQFALFLLIDKHFPTVLNIENHFAAPHINRDHFIAGFRGLYTGEALIHLRNSEDHPQLCSLMEAAASVYYAQTSQGSPARQAMRAELTDLFDELCLIQTLFDYHHNPIKTILGLE